MSSPDVQHFYHEDSGTLSYVLSDPATGAAAVIDPVLGFDIVSGRTDAAQSEAICEFIRDRGLRLRWILETHAHADHLSAAQHVKARLGGDVAIGTGICDVQRHFSRVFNLKSPFRADGRQFDRLFDDGETFELGELEITALATPGHTSDSMTYLVGGMAFVGDSLFMPDAGTARCDFPGGDAGTLYDSIRRLLALPDDTRLFMCHDYCPDGRELRFETTVREQREHNVHVGGGRTRKAFVELREARDATLALPRLILPSLQVNIRAGNLPPPDDNQVVYLRIPLDFV